MDYERLSYLKNYIVQHQRHLDRYVRPLINPAGKRILVIGSGWGTETYWALMGGALYVVGVDPADRPTEPLRDCLSASGDQSLLSRFEHHQCTSNELPTDVEPFDAIISNNVFEHIFDLVGTLRSCKRLLPNRGGRIAIFADPLFYSSMGAHLPVGPWEHLTETQEGLKLKAGPSANWHQYSHGLNKMTLTSFLDAVREADLIIEHLGIVLDRNQRKFPEIADVLPSDLKPMDLLCEGISCRLAFPHNL